MSAGQDLTSAWDGKEQGQRRPHRGNATQECSRGGNSPSLMARRKPLMIEVGWIFCLTRSFALRSSSDAMITTEVVPSPTSLS